MIKFEKEVLHAILLSIAPLENIWWGVIGDNPPFISLILPRTWGIIIGRCGQRVDVHEPKGARQKTSIISRLKSTHLTDLILDDGIGDIYYNESWNDAVVTIYVIGPELIANFESQRIAN